MPRRSNVKIDAQTVTVKGNSPAKSAAPKRARRRQRKQRVGGPVKTVVADGIQTGLAQPSLQRLIAPKHDGLTDQAQQLVVLYCDPLGESTRSTDAARVCDGALQVSAGAFFREVTTLSLPWSEAGEVELLSGQVYSMLVLQMPLLRQLCMVIVHSQGKEFDDQTMNYVFEEYANIDPASVMYPAWIPSGDPNGYVWFTLVDASAMRNITPPSAANGVSPTIDSYRFSSQGVEVFFNTPDLVNQGTVVAIRYPLNHATKTINVEAALVGADPHYLHSTRTSGDAGVSVALNGHENELFPVFAGVLTDFPSPPTAATFGYRNASGSFNVAIGNMVHYRIVTNNVQIFNATTNQFLVLFSVIGPTGISFFNTRFYETANPAGPVREEALEGSYHVITLPPLQQNDMLQQNVKATTNLLKDWNGVYLPSCIYEPVFHVTHAVDYHKTVLVNSLSNLLNMTDPGAGWHDTVEQNFSVAVINMQGIPYAARPMLKLGRSVEIVGSQHSIIGAFATGAPIVQGEALDVMRAFTDCQPHGYPPAYNGLGVLAGKLFGVLNKIPAYMQSARNIARCVENICDQSMPLVTTVADTSRRVRGLFRR